MTLCDCKSKINNTTEVTVKLVCGITSFTHIMNCFCQHKQPSESNILLLVKTTMQKFWFYEATSDWKYIWNAKKSEWTTVVSKTLTLFAVCQLRKAVLVGLVLHSLDDLQDVLLPTRDWLTPLLTHHPWPVRDKAIKISKQDSMDIVALARDYCV